MFEAPRANPIKGVGCIDVVPRRGGGWQEVMVLVCLLLAAPIGLSPLYIPTLCGFWLCQRSPRWMSCPVLWGRLSQRRAVARAVDQCIQMHTPTPCWICRLQH